MKNKLYLYLYISTFVLLYATTFAQNVGIGLINPSAKLHIKGSANASQLIIEGSNTQSNANPLLKIRNFLGKDLIWISADDTTNIFLGRNSGRYNVSTSGKGNSFFGNESGSSNTNGYSNTATGFQSLKSNTFGYYNTAVGTNALSSNSNGTQNTALGTSAMTANNGDFNTAIGAQVMEANSSGINNTSLGQTALQHNTSGNYNSAVGSEALINNVTASNNSALGFRALQGNTYAQQNVAIGTEALSSQSYANSNVPYNSNNVVIGYRALYLNQPGQLASGTNNTAIGFKALYSNATGKENTANGSNAMFANTGGSWNTSNGSNSLSSNTTGTLNTATGTDALLSSTTGGSNTANGGLALHDNQGGSGNTAMGNNALTHNISGNYNTAVGMDASFDLSSVSNTTCLGYNSGGIVDVSNRIEIGNTSVSVIAGQIGFSTYSDARIKDNVTENVPGLSFITKLRPVTYNLNIHRENAMVYKDKNKEDADWEGKYDLENVRMTGFLAQEVEQAAKDAGYDFSGVQKPANPDELYSLRYSDFVMPLVKATQELNQKLNAEFATLKSENDALTQRIEKLEALILTPKD